MARHSSMSSRLCRRSLALLLGASTIAAACSKNTGVPGSGGVESRSGTAEADPAPKEHAPADERPAQAAQETPGGAAAGLVRSGLPAGAVARIGVPVLSSAEAIQRIVSTGALILTCGYRHVRLWEAETGALLWNTVATRDSVQCALSPSGRYIVVSQGDSNVELRVVDWKAGTELETTSPLSSRVFGFVLSPDDSQLLVQTAWLALRAPDHPKTVASAKGLALTAAFAPDGTVLGVGEDKVFTWEPASGQKEATVIATLPARNMSGAISADGSTAAWVNRSGLGIVKVATGEVMPLELALDGKPVQVALSPKGDLLAVGTESSVSVWNVASKSKLWAAKTKYEPAPVFTPDGSQLLFTDVRRVFRADARTGQTAPVAPRAAFAGWATGDVVIISEGERTWAVDPTTGEPAKPVKAVAAPEGMPNWVDEFHIAGDGLVLGIRGEQAGECGALEVWISNQGERSLPKPPKCDAEATLDTWHAGPGIVVAANTAKPEVWDAVAKKKLFSVERGKRPLIASAVSADRKTLFLVLDTAGPAEELADDEAGEEPRTGTRFEAWSIERKELLGSVRVDKQGVTAVAITRDGRRAYIGWSDGTVDMADTSTMKDVTTLGTQTSAITELVLSPDGTMLAATDEDRSTTIWKSEP